MGATTFLLWAAIISSVVALIGYEIWNVIVVGKDMANISRASHEQSD